MEPLLEEPPVGRDLRIFMVVRNVPGLSEFLVREVPLRAPWFLVVMRDVDVLLEGSLRHILRASHAEVASLDAGFRIPTI